MMQNSRDAEQDYRAAGTGSGGRAALGLGDAATKSGGTLVSSAGGGRPPGPPTTMHASLRHAGDGQQSSSTENRYAEKLRSFFKQQPSWAARPVAFYPRSLVPSFAAPYLTIAALNRNEPLPSTV